MLPELDLTGHHPAGHLHDRAQELLLVVEHDEALHPRTVDEQAHVVGRPGHALGGVVLADGPANHDAGLLGQEPQTNVEDFAADIVKIDIDPVRTGGLQLFVQ